MVRVSSPAKLRPWSELTAKMVMGVVPGLVTKLGLFLGQTRFPQCKMVREPGFVPGTAGLVPAANTRALPKGQLDQNIYVYVPLPCLSSIPKKTIALQQLIPTQHQENNGNCNRLIRGFQVKTAPIITLD